MTTDNTNKTGFNGFPPYGSTPEERKRLAAVKKQLAEIDAKKEAVKAEKAAAKKKAAATKKPTTKKQATKKPAVKKPGNTPAKSAVKRAATTKAATGRSTQAHAVAKMETQPKVIYIECRCGWSHKEPKTTDKPRKAARAAHKTHKGKAK